MQGQFAPASSSTTHSTVTSTATIISIQTVYLTAISTTTVTLPAFTYTVSFEAPTVTIYANQVPTASLISPNTGSNKITPQSTVVQVTAVRKAVGGSLSNAFVALTCPYPGTVNESELLWTCL